MREPLGLYKTARTGEGQEQRASIIADHYRRLITTGQLLPGEPFPSGKELCDEFAATRKVVYIARRILKAEGLLVVRGMPGVSGRRSFVSGGSDA
jgi:DNA-binding FadR family transcriptional regulator